MNTAYDVTDKYHLPKRPGDLCVVDLYGSLPISQGNDKYIFVFYEITNRCNYMQSILFHC